MAKPKFGKDFYFPPEEIEQPRSLFFYARELAINLGQDLELTSSEKLAMMIGYLHGSAKDT